MSSPAFDVATILANSAIGVLGTDIFVGEMPEENPSRNVPHRCIAVIDAGGNFSNPKWKRDELVIQILVRSPLHDYNNGYNLAYSIKNSLLGSNPGTINNSLYSLFVLEGDINSLGKDENGRARFTLRFRVVRENFTGDSREDF